MLAPIHSFAPPLALTLALSLPAPVAAATVAVADGVKPISVRYPPSRQIDS